MREEEEGGGSLKGSKGLRKFGQRVGEREKRGEIKLPGDPYRLNWCCTTQKKNNEALKNHLRKHFCVLKISSMLPDY